MDKSDLIVEKGTNVSDPESGSNNNSRPAKKKFVAPEISVPVDVLEATTFFQVAESGVTN